MLRFMGVLMFAVVLAAPGCVQKATDDQTPENKVTSEDVQRDAGRAVNTAVEYSQQTKEEFQKKIETKLKELDAKTDKLREQGRDLKDDAKANWDQKMADLEKKRQEAHAKLIEIGHASGEAWKDVQKGAQSTWDELDKSVRDAAKEF